eukprot:CAMPEP_0168478650 /NCGR_PEP_ID=MMETSP0228-20121227/63065_1 /TAXON_ID=133427 /ORGANISM="Protoceratium reticulatum, Strain CCCM 535 (=CCMP 1889)" /LENGTH=51 /DNA_ID=CAMNT_0008494913 /DNA_START=21 /DNA_END=172 /DNA_ORIENTATION=+
MQGRRATSCDAACSRPEAAGAAQGIRPKIDPQHVPPIAVTQAPVPRAGPEV